MIADNYAFIHKRMAELKNAPKPVSDVPVEQECKHQWVMIAGKSVCHTCGLAQSATKTAPAEDSGLCPCWQEWDHCQGCMGPA